MKKVLPILNILFVFAMLLTLSLSARAFSPDYPRAGVPGEHHTRITLEALDEIYAAYGYGSGGKSYTTNMKNARERIAKANASVDSSRSNKMSASETPRKFDLWRDGFRLRSTHPTALRIDELKEK
ncbi:MAG: hypothetical protein LBB65_00680 [Burkholderiales bacterium]|jgi:hypothetical protein|nr:hypothetical protein [Burkholderiales bacterium]